LIAPTFVVVDVRCHIRYVSAADDGELNRIIASRVKLQPDVEAFIRGLPVESDDSSSPVRAGLLSDNRVLRVVRVVGSEGTLFILSVEEDRNCNSMARAARRHQLTRRETEVLSLILDGSSAGEIAQMLALSEHTVQGYFKRLLFKTGARNRVSMVAGIFDWVQMRGARPIAPAVQGHYRAPLRESPIDATA
jgi:DNA-binding CsgD family transcriptional regulator